MNSFTVVFVFFLAAMAATQLWLARRHITNVLKHRPAVPDSFKDSISLDDHQKAADYTTAKTQLGMIETGFGTMILLGWTLAGGLEILNQFVTSWEYSAIITGTCFILGLMIISSIIELPMSLYSTFVLEERFGFNKTTPTTFAMDMFKGLLLMLIIGTPLLMAVLWIMEKMGTYWWFYVWLVWTGFSLLMLWAYPVIIAPLFNKFRPLEEGSTRDRIQSLLKRTGFKSKGIFVMDGSKRSAHGNAYFTGFGKNKRIVFFDTLLESLSDPEMEAVLAHELGHFKRHHVIKRMVVIFSTSLAGLFLLGWLMQQQWFFSGLGVGSTSTYMALTLFMIAGPVFTFFLSPLSAWFSRKHEFEADEFAAKTADANDLVSALVKMYKENAATLTPDKLHSAFYDSHPPAPIRIAHLQSIR